jgi:hypothetical protein
MASETIKPGTYKATSDEMRLANRLIGELTLKRASQSLHVAKTVLRDIAAGQAVRRATIYAFRKGLAKYAQKEGLVQDDADHQQPAT